MMMLMFAPIPLMKVVLMVCMALVQVLIHEIQSPTPVLLRSVVGLFRFL